VDIGTAFKKDTVVFVTGTSSGIGNALAERYLDMGFRVAGVSRGLTVFKKKYDRRKSLFMRGDITNRKTVQASIRKIIDLFGTIDIFVHAAGNTHRAPFHKVTCSAWDHVMDTNLKGAFYCLKEIIPLMQGSGGSILLIGSVGSLASWEDEVVYQIAKTGFLAMARGIALENAKYNIRANVLCPGLINAPMLTSLINSEELPDEFRKELLRDVPLGRFGSTNDIVNAAIFITSGWASYITGTALLVDGGYCAR
jgi:NAD(P)-dependent dehydrogenase (short-subunit alcohol dehydrogenase family)